MVIRSLASWDDGESPLEHGSSTFASDDVGRSYDSLARTLQRAAIFALALPFLGGTLMSLLWPEATAATLGVVAVGFTGAALLGGLSGLASRGFGARGSLQVTPTALVVERRRDGFEIPLDQVSSGVVVRSKGGATRVELTLTHGNPVFAKVADEQVGHRLLRAAGLGADRRRAVFRFGKPHSDVGKAFAFMLGPAYLVGLGKMYGYSSATLLTFMAMSFFAAMALVVLTRPAELTVGTDGLFVKTRLRERFIPFAEIESMRRFGATILFQLSSGRPLMIPPPIPPDLVEAALARIRAAKKARQKSDEADQRLAVVRRGGRSVDDWKRDLGRIFGAGSYREATLSREELSALVESARASADERIGAALALSTGGEEAAAPVRIAAGLCADPRLRIALETIADGAPDEAALEEALAAQAPDRVVRAG